MFLGSRGKVLSIKVPSPNLYFQKDFLILIWADVHRERNRKDEGQLQEPRRHRFIPWVRKIAWGPWAWKPTPVFLPGESHGQRILVGYTP